MYRQVELDKEDKDYHRLFWKDPNSEAIETFRMTRVTYGIASSLIGRSQGWNFVPRLELCAALLGAKLVEAVTNAISDERFPNPKVFAWSDSTVTIAWLQDYPRKWKTFVVNRVAKIQEIIPASSWNYDNPEDNPADCASRG